MTDETMVRTSNPHAGWLREIAKRLAGENQTSRAHTCDQAANEIDAIERHRTQFAERLADCERSLGTFDSGAVSEYWLKYAPGAMHATSSETSARACRYTQADEDTLLYLTDCGREFWRNGTHDLYDFCHFCGGAVEEVTAVKANTCQCDPNPSIGGSPPCPVHDGESEL